MGISDCGSNSRRSTVDMLNTIRSNWRIHLLCGVLFVLITVPLAAAYRYFSLHQYDASRPHVPEVKKLADQTPVYPGFRRINEDSVSLLENTVTLLRSYRMAAQSADVKKFYDSALLKNGWEPREAASSSIINGEPYAFIYERDEYQICVYRRMT